MLLPFEHPRSSSGQQMESTSKDSRKVHEMEGTAPLYWLKQSLNSSPWGGGPEAMLKAGLTFHNMATDTKECKYPRGSCVAAWTSYF